MTDSINWFPGHMAKAKREIRGILPLVDLVIELADARIPETSRNPDFDELFKSKPSVLILTKASLADIPRTNLVVSKQNRSVLTIDCRTGAGMNRITPLIREILKEKIEKNNAKGINKPLRCLVAGITNVGKSTFINTYAKAKKAKVENRPGVTRKLQWISADNGIELLDTPGILWPKFGDPMTGVKLAALGSIRDDILDVLELSYKTLLLLAEKYPEKLMERYKIDLKSSDAPLAIFEKIGRKRGFLITGGQIDEERTANCILDELREGKLGAITLD